MKKERTDIQGISHKDHHLFAIVIKYKILMTKASTNELQFCPNKKKVRQVSRSKVHHINENFEMGISHHCHHQKD
jgi:hypothetical protein